ncbi:DUF1758 domain-containing protein [Trichonephila clavipes]|nr:DUF1758 domain-containing protein [Trichonephila clavipes]
MTHLLIHFYSPQAFIGNVLRCSSIEGKPWLLFAAKLIRGFAITVDNLKNCWDILRSRYENKRQLALSQINKLFSIKISAANTSKLLLEIIDIWNEVIRNLKTLDLETNSLTELIIINFLISQRCISQQWDLSLENNKIPTLEEFRVFIEREARGLNELKFVKPDIKKVSPSADTQANSVVTVSNNYTHSAECHVLLSTALINVKSKHGQQITCHSSIDNASQNSLISKQCADRLKLQLKHTNHKLVGVNETFAETSLYSTNYEFSSCVSSDKFQVKALLVSKVTSAMPNFPVKYHEWPHIKDLTLAYQTFYIENEIDILLGADVFMTLISGTPIMGPKGTPSALTTKLGHLLSDTINTQYNQNSSPICHTHLNIDHSLKQFWELESVPKDILSKDEDELCESIFVNSHIRKADGRYILKLPFRDDSSLGDSKEGALKRFYSLERKLHSNNQLKEQYTEFMEEYQNLGHMTPLASDVKSPHYFLPHYGVINDNSSTTKLRVVFDGSFKSTNGNSLNDILLTVTYGTSCASFLAIRTLKQLCDDEKHRFPQATKLAKDPFYVDYLLAGADSFDSARKIVHELQNLMSVGGFELRKWSCTHPEVLSDLVNFHAGQELVLSLIHQQFWIPHGKSAVKKKQRNCIDCFKLVAKPVSQMMGDLPIERINPCRAFEKVGSDKSPKNLQVLTPGHFLIGRLLLELPDHSLTNQFLSIYSRWSPLKKLKRMFWSRWQLSYFNTLQSRTKWMQGQKDLTVGSLILIKNPASFSTRWTPGRIVATHSGADGICRVVTIQTSSGVMTRPVSQVSVLPLPPSTTSSRPPENVKNS